MYTKPQDLILRAITVIILCCIPFSLVQAKSTFEVTYTDSSNEGFNDSKTVTSPIGNNTATTLGGQRKQAFEFAVSILSVVLHSDITIKIDAHFDALGGSQFSATLANAGPNTVHFDFSGSPQSNVYYVQALANKLNGNDLDAQADIDAQFNSDIDGSTVLGNGTWYYGLDANADDIDTDFVSVALHELIHGLGFLTLGSTSSGSKFQGRDDAYSFFLELDGATVSSYSAMSSSQRAAANKATGDLQWGGTQTEDNITAFLTSGLNGTNPEIYAPNPLESGSSVSHFSDSLTPNQIMEPFYSGPDHNVGIAGAVLADMGWGNFTNLSVVITDAVDPVGAGDNISLTATVTNEGNKSAPDSVFTYTIPDGLSHSSSSASQGSCTTTSNNITCSLGTINAGGSTTISLALTTSNTGSVTHTAVVYANIVDVSPSNNTDTETTSIQGAGTVTTNSGGSTTTTSTDTIASSLKSGGGGSTLLILILMFLLVYKTSNFNGLIGR